VAALDDAELDVRVAAATALGELGPAAAEAIPALEAALADPGKKIRVVAEEALEQIRKQPAQ
jgi:HEAT repeat protein